MALDMISTPRSSRNPLNAVNPVLVFRDPRVSSTLSTGSRSSRVPSGSQRLRDLPGEPGEHHRFGDLRVVDQRRPAPCPGSPGPPRRAGRAWWRPRCGSARRRPSRRPPRPATPAAPVGFPRRWAGPGAGSPGRRGPGRRHRPGRCTTVAAATPRWTPRRAAGNTRRVSSSPVRWTCAAYTNRPTRSNVSARVSRSLSPIFQNALPRNASNPAHTDPATAVACSMSLIGSMNRTLDHTTDSPRNRQFGPLRSGLTMAAGGRRRVATVAQPCRHTIPRSGSPERFGHPWRHGDRPARQPPT